MGVEAGRRQETGRQAIGGGNTVSTVVARTGRM